MLEKCKWYNNQQTACSLMIDDLAPVAISMNGNLSAFNDWGYLMDAPNSLYEYLNKWLFQKYPEICGTIFLPIESHYYIPQNFGYKVFTRDLDDVFISFLKVLQDRFEFAFHGIKHTWFDDKNNIIFEYENSDIYSLEENIKRIELFSKLSGIRFIGGKFPGYKYNKISLNLINSLESKWWALDANMINRRCKENIIENSNDQSYICIPTNVSGDLFKKSPSSLIKKIKKRFINNYYQKPEKYIQYLYDKRLPITIQEHYQKQGEDGKHQHLNLYDDVKYLDDLFGFLRSLDIWYANCSDIAHYFDSFNKTQITINDKKIIINYKGLWDNPFISLKTDYPFLIYENGQYLNGHKKGDYWIHNINKSGVYNYK